jgi:hypothetical protein
MKYIYRDLTIFEYINGDVIQHKTDGVPNFDCCRWTAEACKELAEFFEKVAMHKQVEEQSKYIYKLESETTTVIIKTSDPQGRTGYAHILIGDKFLVSSDFELHRVEPSEDYFDGFSPLHTKIAAFQTETPYWLLRFTPDRQIIPLAPEFRFDDFVRLER